MIIEKVIKIKLKDEGSCYIREAEYTMKIWQGQWSKFPNIVEVKIAAQVNQKQRTVSSKNSVLEDSGNGKDSDTDNMMNGSMQLRLLEINKQRIGKPGRWMKVRRSDKIQ